MSTDRKREGKRKGNAATAAIVGNLQLAGGGDSSERAERLGAGLYPHQVEGVAFLLRRRRAILADDMGLGKTRQAIVALRTAEPGGPYLVVCPASVKRNWAREIELAAPGAAVRILDGSPAGELAGGDGAEWVVVNYDVLGRHVQALARVSWAGFVFDEAHYIKNHKSQRSKHSRALVDGAGGAAAASGATRAEGPLVYALTGTPLTNRPRDLFPLLQLVAHPLGKSFLSFAKRYCAAERTQYGWVTDGASNLEELATQLHGVLLRRRKDDVLELPPKLRTWLDLAVPRGTGLAETRRAMMLLFANAFGGGAAGGNGGRGRGDRAQLLGALSKARRQLSLAKLADTIDFVDGAVEQGEKVLVFCCFDEPARKIAAHFGERAVLLTGATPTGRRQELVDRFQGDEGVRVFVANLVAGGIGINLTAARQVVFHDLDWVPANHWQAEDRAYRIGQTNTVNVTYMVAEGTIDSFVKQALATKTALVEAVIDGGGGAAGDVAGADVLGELERLVRQLSPGFADVRVADLDEGEIQELLRRASSELAAEAQTSGAASTSSGSGARAGSNGNSHTSAMKEALRALAEALAGPASRRYRVASGSRPGLAYDLTVDDAGDVTCSCPGFEYRGMCSHGVKLKTALVAGGGLPSGFSVIS